MPLLSLMRLKSEIFASALVRSVFARGDFAAIERKGAPEGSWLARMLAKKDRLLVAIALANRMARGLWAMLTKGEDYRAPAAA